MIIRSSPIGGNFLSAAVKSFGANFDDNISNDVHRAAIPLIVRLKSVFENRALQVNIDLRHFTWQLIRNMFQCQCHFINIQDYLEASGAVSLK